MRGRPPCGPPSLAYALSLAARRHAWPLALASVLALALLVGAPLALLARDGAVRAARERLVSDARAGVASARILRVGSDHVVGAVVRTLEEVPLRDEPRRAQLRLAVEHKLVSYLAEVEAAARLAALLPGDEDARRALVEAQFALARCAAVTEQWGLASSALSRARREGADDARVDARVDEIRRARERIAEERAAAVRAILDAARGGTLYERGRTYEDALFELAGRAHPETVSLVADALDSCTSVVRAAARARWLLAASPTAVEARLGEGRIEGIDGAVDALHALPPGALLEGREATAVPPGPPNSGSSDDSVCSESVGDPRDHGPSS
jgi:hypothetical protein